MQKAAAPASNLGRSGYGRWVQAPARVFIFDLDGTLVDSLGDIAHHLRTVMAAQGLPAPSDVQTRAWVGSGARELIVRAVAELGGSRSADATLIGGLFDAFMAEYRAQPVITTALYPGMAAQLDHIVREPDVKLAILSNKPHDLTVRISEQLLNAWGFAPVFGQREGIAKKPDPTSALAIAAAYQVAPAQCVFIGDTDVDVETGHAAGMPTLGVTWGIGDPNELRAARPTAAIDHVSFLFSALRDLGR